MTVIILMVAVILLLSVLAERVSDKLGLPALIIFMFLGMIFGSDGLFKIEFENFNLAENICSAALILIMFYGGFNTRWSAAKMVALKSTLLASLGVVITAFVTTGLCMLILRFSFAESFLIGSVLSSTDAASVFAILRKKNLNLRDGTASLLEVESGSNDPASYMLTLIAVGLLVGESQAGIALVVFLQLFFGVAVGVLAAILCNLVIAKTALVPDGLETIFLLAVVMLCFGVCDALGGNAYLSVYLFGIIVGNGRIRHMKTMVPFFDGVTTLSQIVIFFFLGLLSLPHEIPSILPIAIAVVIFITIIARPVAVFAILLPFHCSVRQCLLVSWAGLRGASSSVFAVIAVAAGVGMGADLFHIVFAVSLFSVAIQGTLLPFVARKLGMVDESGDVHKTFNDYQEEAAFSLISLHIDEGSRLENKTISELGIPEGFLAIMLRRGTQSIITKGDTEILAGDDIVFSTPSFEMGAGEFLTERYVSEKDSWCGKTLDELKIPKNKLVVMVIRGSENITPNGKTRLLAGDRAVIYQQSQGNV